MSESVDMTPKPTGLLVVVVVYERDIDQVTAWPQLQKWLNSDATEGSAAPKHVLVYDNSLRPRARPVAPSINCTYIHDPTNGGTASAICGAVALAAARDVSWLLLLDHDSTLPDEFFSVVGKAISCADVSANVRAFVPWVVHGHKLAVSPSTVTRLGSLRAIHPHRAIKPRAQITAVASGSVLSTAALVEILPFPEGLWLDYVDHWIFAQLHRRGYRVRILDVTIEHDLSIAGPVRLTPARLLSLLRGESRYYGLLGLYARLLYPLRVGWRLTRMTVTDARLACVAWWWIFGGKSPRHDR